MWYIQIYNGILPSHFQDEKMPLAKTWWDLDIIILCEVSQK